VPLLAGRLTGSRLVLADLGPRSAPKARATRRRRREARSAERVIPDRKFDLPSLRAMDANVLIDIAMFDPGTTIIEPLRPVHAHLLLADGVLTIADFDGRTAQGRLAGFLQLDGRGKQALWTATCAPRRRRRTVAAHQAQRPGLAHVPSRASSTRSSRSRAPAARAPRSSAASTATSAPTCARARSRILVIEALGLDVAQALG
jgi:hypothetical protein